MPGTVRKFIVAMADQTIATTAFERDALPHLDTLYRVALRFAGEPAGAEDLVQDTMLRAFRGWSGFRPGTNVRAWLLTILRNTFINEYRRRRREPVPMDLDAIEPYAVHDVTASDPEGDFFSQIVDTRVLEAVDALPEPFREVVVLSDMEGLNYSEIAEAIGVPVGTVKSRLFRGRRQLQRDLYDHAVAMGYITAQQEPSKEDR